jgi:hypothetical protein
MRVLKKIRYNFYKLSLTDETSFKDHNYCYNQLIAACDAPNAMANNQFREKFPPAESHIVPGEETQN